MERVSDWLNSASARIEPSPRNEAQSRLDPMQFNQEKYHPSNFLFSGRRRHTRWPRAWSSDVCSSDLTGSIYHRCISRLLGKQRINAIYCRYVPAARIRTQPRQGFRLLVRAYLPRRKGIGPSFTRSEERRVGEECRGGCDTYQHEDDTS